MDYLMVLYTLEMIFIIFNQLIDALITQEYTPMLKKIDLLLNGGAGDKHHHHHRSTGSTCGVSDHR